MAQEFSIGDVVQLKSGGPKMTVIDVGNKIRCGFFNKNDDTGVLLVYPEALKKASSSVKISPQ